MISFPYLLQANPCPCGYYGCSNKQCRCSVRQIENYRQKISGPLLDRIDIHVEVPQVDFREITSDVITGESSAVIRERVAAARGIQVARFKSAKLTTNSAMGAKQVRECCKLDAEERLGKVQRDSNTHELSPEEYALRLYRDGLQKGWLFKG